jgi:hypothetical protein
MARYNDRDNRVITDIKVATASALVTAAILFLISTDPAWGAAPADITGAGVAQADCSVSRAACQRR